MTNDQPTTRSFSLIQGGESARALTDNVTRAYDAARKKLRDLESEHRLARAKLEDDYQKRIDDLHHEIDEACRSLDQRFTGQIDDARREVEAIRKMRGGQ